jgi:hypothetical protein
MTPKKYGLERVYGRPMQMCIPAFRALDYSISQTGKVVACNCQNGLSAHVRIGDTM